MCTSNSLGGYPLGAENDPRAPFNEKPKKKVLVNVTISVTYSKTLDIVAVFSSLVFICIIDCPIKFHKICVLFHLHSRN